MNATAAHVSKQGITCLIRTARSVDPFGLGASAFLGSMDITFSNAAAAFAHASLGSFPCFCSQSPCERYVHAWLLAAIESLGLIDRTLSYPVTAFAHASLGSCPCSSSQYP